MAAAVSLPNPDRFGYLKPKDVARLAEAYRFSEAAHAGQTRQSGDPYISHPLAVAEILADWHLDGQTLMAALPVEMRSEEHTSELQSRSDLVCRLLLEKKTHRYLVYQPPSIVH